MATVFLDTETLGLDRAAPVWEFAGLRVEDDGQVSMREHFQIRHHAGFWLDKLTEDAPAFAGDYRARYDEETALWEWDAVRRIRLLTTGGPVIAGSNPAFDMERLETLMHRTGFGAPEWHYHPLDVPTLALGWLAARGNLPVRPWKSDEISAACGIEPEDYDRHTAMGDVLWTRDLYAALNTGGVW